MEEYIQNIHDSLFPEIYRYVEAMSGFSQLLAVIFMIIWIGVKVMSYSANLSGNLDPYILIRPILILVAILFYEPLIDLLLEQPVDIVAGIARDGANSVLGSSGSFGVAEKWDSFTSGVSEDFDANQVWEVLQLDSGLEFIHLLIFLAARAIVGYILLRQLVFKGIYLILGVFVLPFSLIPGNQDILKKWFFGFLAVLLWIPVLTIVQTILLLIGEITKNANFGDALFLIALQIMTVIAILRVPRYANFLVAAGSESGQRFSENAVAQPVIMGAKTLASIKK